MTRVMQLVVLDRWYFHLQYSTERELERLGVEKEVLHSSFFPDRRALLRRYFEKNGCSQTLALAALLASACTRLKTYLGGGSYPIFGMLEVIDAALLSLYSSSVQRGWPINYTCFVSEIYIIMI